MNAIACCICLAPFSMAMTVAEVSAWAPSMMVAMRAEEVFERSARRRTSSATTAKPWPPSPARAASMAALRASRLVWSAISLISPRITPTSLTRFGQRQHPEARLLDVVAGPLDVRPHVLALHGDAVDRPGDGVGGLGQLLDGGHRLAEGGRALDAGGGQLLGCGRQLGRRRGHLACWRRASARRSPGSAGGPGRAGRRPSRSAGSGSEQEEPDDAQHGVGPDAAPRVGGEPHAQFVEGAVDGGACGGDRVGGRHEDAFDAVGVPVLDPRLHGAGGLQCRRHLLEGRPRRLGEDGPGPADGGVDLLVDGDELGAGTLVAGEEPGRDEPVALVDERADGVDGDAAPGLPVGGAVDVRSGPEHHDQRGDRGAQHEQGEDGEDPPPAADAEGQISAAGRPSRRVGFHPERYRSEPARG